MLELLFNEFKFQAQCLTGCPYLGILPLTRNWIIKLRTTYNNSDKDIYFRFVDQKRNNQDFLTSKAMLDGEAFIFLDPISEIQTSFPNRKSGYKLEFFKLDANDNLVPLDLKINGKVLNCFRFGVKNTSESYHSYKIKIAP
jgi:hypothetical protein